MRISQLLPCLFFLGGCAIFPEGGGLAPLRPVYEIPTATLSEKAETLFHNTIHEHLNEDAYLLYAVKTPLADNYEEAHIRADLPTWHGHWLMALAFREATLPSGANQALIKQGLKAIKKNFEVTGVPGLLARAYVKNDSSELDTWWKQKYTLEKYPTKPWLQGKGGYWFRAGIAKGHYNGTFLGLAALTGLGIRNINQYDDETWFLLRELSVTLTHYIIDNDYTIKDYDGETSEFGYLNDFSVNGQTTVLIAAMLRTCAALDPSPKCYLEYKKLIEDPMPGKAMELYGTAIRKAFGEYADAGNELYKTNDTHHAAVAILAHYLVANDNLDTVQLQRNVRLLDDLSVVAGKERNTFFNFTHILLRSFAGLSGIYRSQDFEASKPSLEEMRQDGIETLRLYPIDKRNIECDETHTRFVQPIANMKMNSHYWKTSFYTLCTRPAGPPVYNGVEYSAQDYLSVYYMGSFFGLLGENFLPLTPKEQ